MNTISSIKTKDEYDAAVGRTISFCQCIEHDIKAIFYGMISSMTDADYKKSERWTLGQTINALEKLDNSDGKPFFAEEDYKLLKEVTGIRNYYAHNCYTAWAYKEAGRQLEHAFLKSAQRLTNDHNRLFKLYQIIQTVRIRFYS